MYGIYAINLQNIDNDKEYEPNVLSIWEYNTYIEAIEYLPKITKLLLKENELLDNENIFIKYNENSIDIFHNSKCIEHGYLYSNCKFFTKKIMKIQIIAIKSQNKNYNNEHMTQNYDIVLQELKEQF